MKFGVREICDVVLRAKATQKVGKKIFYKNEPVIYFDTLKTSSMEGAATTVYAQGGRGNSRLMAWEGERTVTFTMEDALISPEGFMILSGAGLISAEDKPIYVHTTERVVVSDKGIVVTQMPYTNENSEKPEESEHLIYVMVVDEFGDPDSEPYVYTKATPLNDGKDGWKLESLVGNKVKNEEGAFEDGPTTAPGEGTTVLVDYYVKKTSDTSYQINITPDKFGGNYYLEASTLFRNRNGVDMPAEFIIPNCKIQSNFTFTMASSGDPSTFTFTMDAFPDYTRFDPTTKVLAAIQVISDPLGDEDGTSRQKTPEGAAKTEDPATD